VIWANVRPTSSHYRVTEKPGGGGRVPSRIPRRELPVRETLFLRSRRRFLAQASGGVLASATLTQVSRTLATSRSPTDLPVVELVAAIRSAQLTSEAVVSAHLDRIDQVNPRLNAVVQLRREGAGRCACGRSRSRSHGTSKRPSARGRVRTRRSAPGITRVTTDPMAAAVRAARSGGIVTAECREVQQILPHQLQRFGRRNGAPELDRTSRRRRHERGGRNRTDVGCDGPDDE
jgi:hypothetical protein